MGIKTIAYGGVALILIALAIWGAHTYLANAALLAEVGGDPDEFIHRFGLVALGAAALTIGFALFLRLVLPKEDGQSL